MHVGGRVVGHGGVCRKVRESFLKTKHFDRVTLILGILPALSTLDQLEPVFLGAFRNFLLFLLVEIHPWLCLVHW